MTAGLWYGVGFLVALLLIFGLGREFNETTKKTETTFTTHGITQFRKGMDIAGGVRLSYKIDFSKYNQLYANQAERDQAKTQAIQVILKNIDNRISALGVSDYSARQQLIGDEIFLIVEIGGVHSIDNAKEIIGKTVELEFKVPAKASEKEALVAKNKQLADDLFAKIKANPEQIAELTEGKQGDDIFLTQFTGSDVDTLSPVYRSQKETIIAAQSGDIISAQGVYLEAQGTDSEPIEWYTLLLIDHIAQWGDEPVSLEKIVGVADQYGKSFGIATGVVHTGNTGELYYDNTSQEIRYNSDVDASAFWTWWGSQVLAIQNVSPDESGKILQTLRDRILIYGTEVFVNKNPQWVTAINPGTNEILNGAFFSFAAPGVSQFWKPVVTINFNSKGQEIFCALTKTYVNQQMAIFVGWVMQTAPVINEPICWWSAQIDGSFDSAWAKALSDNLNTGALPAPLILSSEEKVSPALGEWAINGAFLAAGIGILLMSLFLLIFYGRIPTFVGLSVIVVFLAYSLAVFKLIDYAFSLSGIAAVILSLAMSIDANIIMYERLQEELKAGKSRLSAVDSAYERSWLAIRDGNMTNIIIYVVLFGIGMSVFKWFGFAGLITGLLVLLVNVPLMKILLKVYKKK